MIVINFFITEGKNCWKDVRWMILSGSGSEQQSPVCLHRNVTSTFFFGGGVSALIGGS